jgi:hypothetical protein
MNSIEERKKITILYYKQTKDMWACQNCKKTLIKKIQLTKHTKSSNSI